MRRLTLVLSCALLTAAVSFGENSRAMFGYSPNGTQQLILNGTIILQASTAGWYDETGANNTNGPGISNYIAGICGSSDACDGNNYNQHDYFVFDLSGVTATITSAQLSIGNLNSTGYIDPNPRAVYSCWDVSTPIPELIASQSGRPGIFQDLGSGFWYANTVVSAASDGTQVVVNLNAAAIASIQAAEGGSWAVGGSMPPPPQTELGGAGLAPPPNRAGTGRPRTH
jgi:hypothetical protein